MFHVSIMYKLRSNGSLWRTCWRSESTKIKCLVLFIPVLADSENVTNRVDPADLQLDCAKYHPVNVSSKHYLEVNDYSQSTSFIWGSFFMNTKGMNIAPISSPTWFRAPGVFSVRINWGGNWQVPNYLSLLPTWIRALLFDFYWKKSNFHKRIFRWWHYLHL